LSGLEGDTSKMKIKPILILSIIFLVLLFYVYFFELKNEEDVYTLLEIKTNNIKFIELISEKKMIRLEKNNKEWTMTNPLKWRLDKEILIPLLNSISNLRAVRIVAEEGYFSLEEYGLDSPYLRIRIGTDNYEKDETILIGNKSPVGGGYFATKEDGGKLYRVGEYLIDDFINKTVFELRDKKIIDYDIEQIKSVNIIKNGEEEISLEKKEDIWFVINPYKFVSHEQTDIFLNRIIELETLSFIDNPTNLPNYSFNNPELEIDLLFNNGESRKIRIIQTNTVENNAKIFVKTYDKESLYEITERELNDLLWNFFDFIDKKVFVYNNIDDVKSLTIEIDNKEYQYNINGKESKNNVNNISGEEILNDFKYIFIGKFVGSYLNFQEKTYNRLAKFDLELTNSEKQTVEFFEGENKNSIYVLKKIEYGKHIFSSDPLLTILGKYETETTRKLLKNIMDNE
jgi:DNA-dependent RNA polymerase auxiliary subunit epsilon